MRRLIDIAFLGGLFLAVAYGLNAYDVWGLLGVTRPYGFEAQGLLFLGVYYLFGTLLFDPYLKVMAERRAQTVGKKSAAEKTRAQAEEMLRKYRVTIEEAHVRAIRERERLALEAEDEERRCMASAKEKANADVADVAEQARRDGEAIRGALMAQAGALADEIADKVLALRDDRGGGLSRVEAGR